MTPDDNIELVNSGSGDGLLPDGTKPLPEQVLTSHRKAPVSIHHLKVISRAVPHPSFAKIR